MLRIALWTCCFFVWAHVGIEAVNSNEVIIGNVRIQALSPTLVRIEPLGPRGFEDHTTFMVTSREFSGIPLTRQGDTKDGTLLKTEFYNIFLRNTSDKAAPPTCAAPITSGDLADTVRSESFPNGTVVASRADCCSACESDPTCSTWIYNPWKLSEKLSAADASGANCWPVKSYSSSYAVDGTASREFGCSSSGCGLTRAGAEPMTKTDVTGGKRSKKHRFGAKVSNRQECSELCEADTSCVAWVHLLPKPNEKLYPFRSNCFPLTGFAGVYSAGADYTEVGCSSGGCRGEMSSSPAFSITMPNGERIYDTAIDAGTAKNLLHWPAPLSTSSYGLTDYPRFSVPEWGTAPPPTNVSVDPALKSTNGYDFRNNVPGDTYVFLLGSNLSSWQASRSEFIQLAGECPLLPDYAYGTWFTWWHLYTEAEAKNDVQKWANLSLPLDIWGLDMNWRLTNNNQDRHYNHPNTTAFPNFTEWFEFMRVHGVRTFFNDHPYPVSSRHAGGMQTSAQEVQFRWEGLSSWMENGLSFWWFDHNWFFSIPPPFVECNGHTDGNWDGLDNAAWGSHVYFSDVSQFNKRFRDPAGDRFNGGRPVTLTKFARPDWRPGMDPIGHAESPAQHRYPVWWTGDGVDLQASVETMVDSGVHDFKPFVHSDCGGDYRGSAGDLMRWTAHCAFGSILRFHGDDHRSWTYDEHTVEIVRFYLNKRYKLMPSIIAAGQKATETGFPLVARGDLLWPEHSESSTNHQYVFINDILVAPIFNSTANITSRTVWIPPGDWEDFWDGSVVTGPQTFTVSQPYERQPMWYRAAGGLLVLADTPGLRVDEQDWSTLTLEAFVSTRAHSTQRKVVEKSNEHPGVSSTTLSWQYDGGAKGSLEIGASDVVRSWVVRLHLGPGQRVIAAIVDGKATDVVNVSQHEYGDSAPKATVVSELHLPQASHARVVNFSIVTPDDELVI